MTEKKTPLPADKISEKATQVSLAESAFDLRRRRLVFRAWHRGIKEMDLIMGNFIEHHQDKLTPSDCDWFEALFEENDHDLLAWITGNKPVPEAWQHPLMAQLQRLDFMKLRAR